MPCRTMLRLSLAVVVLAAAAIPVNGQPASTSPPGPGADQKTGADPVAKDYADHLAALKDADWRRAFALGQEIAALPAEQGWTITRDNWDKVQKVESRQQLLKAWYYGQGFPLKPRVHVHVQDVLDLGKKDPSPEVQEWANNFQKLAAGGKPDAVKPAGEKSVGAKPADEKDAAADIADVPFQNIRIAGDENKRYFLIGPRAGAKKPAAGYRLVLVLPGGDGSEEFRPFVQRVLKNALNDDVMIAQLVAPKWSDGEDRIIWPTSGTKDERMKFTTEQFVDAVIEDAKGRCAVDRKRVDALGWSSGGPPVYTVTLGPKSPIRGAFVAMSVFKPDQLPALSAAAGHRIYILHSPTDFIPMNFPRDAEEKLRKAGATTKLTTYEGGHGWHGDVFATMRTGLEWLDADAK
jgi:predicted esterase